MTEIVTITERINTLCAFLKIPLKDIEKREHIRRWAQEIHDDATITGRRYLIWNHERGAWWKRPAFGYTEHVDEAGKYTFSEAVGITKEANFNLHRMGTPEDSIVGEV